jgi:hypothetical protein
LPMAAKSDIYFFKLLLLPRIRRAYAFANSQTDIIQGAGGV